MQIVPAYNSTIRYLYASICFFNNPMISYLHQLAVSAQDIMQKRIDRLHLWQVFFANPYEWWDNRNCKLNPKSPDFKHKDTGESLWLMDSDPPWINQQLRLHDSRLSKRSPREGRNAWLHLSPLVYDDDHRTWKLKSNSNGEINIAFCCNWTPGNHLLCLVVRMFSSLFFLKTQLNIFQFFSLICHIF